jgi:hypothetical protein
VIRILPASDGTWTVYRGVFVLIAGLTRHQAECYEAALVARKHAALRSAYT